MRLNRHAAVRLHKRKLKKKFAHCAFRHYWTNLKLMEEHYKDKGNHFEWWDKHHPRNNGFNYWQYDDISGRRKFAKKQTNKTIRAKHRGLMANMDPEEVVADRGNDYRKEFDYNWTIW